MVPKPRSKHKYCGVCRKYYEEYLDVTFCIIFSTLIPTRTKNAWRTPNTRKLLRINAKSSGQRMFNRKKFQCRKISQSRPGSTKTNIKTLPKALSNRRSKSSTKFINLTSLMNPYLKICSHDSSFQLSKTLSLDKSTQ